MTVNADEPYGALASHNYYVYVNEQIFPRSAIYRTLRNTYFKALNNDDLLRISKFVNLNLVNGRNEMAMLFKP